MPPIWRGVLFVVFTAGLLILFRDSVLELWRLSSKDETYSHMPLIPLVSGCLLFSGRKAIFSGARPSWMAGILAAACGLALYGFETHAPQGINVRDPLAMMAFSGLTIWLGGFIGIFGIQAFRAAAFPLLFLVFLVPIPSFLLETIVSHLQSASTEVANLLFQVSGVPFLREGYSFHLPGISVTVAEQCSGIRSSISLFITGVLASHLALRTWWGKALLIGSVLPITIFKNALRVLTLSLLAVYVDPRVLDSALHRAGGIPFFGLALVLFGCVLWGLRKAEKRASR